MPLKPLEIRPNIPVRLALEDPAGTFDFDCNKGTYRTTAGETLELPRQAVEALNMLDPAAGEEIEILAGWSGRYGDRWEWSVRKAQETMRDENRPESTPEPRREPISGPKRVIPIRREPEPGLFDLGTGTRGPAPARRPRSVLEIIPADVAFREVSAWVAAELRANNLQWSDTAQQAMVCTVLIAEYKAGRIGPWERGK